MFWLCNGNAKKYPSDIEKNVYRHIDRKYAFRGNSIKNRVYYYALEICCNKNNNNNHNNNRKRSEKINYWVLLLPVFLSFIIYYYYFYFFLLCLSFPHTNCLSLLVSLGLFTHCFSHVSTICIL